MKFLWNCLLYYNWNHFLKTSFFVWRINCQFVIYMCIYIYKESRWKNKKKKKEENRFIEYSSILILVKVYRLFKSFETSVHKYFASSADVRRYSNQLVWCGFFFPFFFFFLRIIFGYTSRVGCFRDETWRKTGEQLEHKSNFPSSIKC